MGCHPSNKIKRERERERERSDIIGVCAAGSIISVLTQWGATLVIKIRERERECPCERERERKESSLFLRRHFLNAQTPLSVAHRAPHARLRPGSTHESGHRAPPQPQKIRIRARQKSVAPLLIRHTDTRTLATVALVNAVASGVTQTPPMHRNSHPAASAPDPRSQLPTCTIDSRFRAAGAGCGTVADQSGVHVPRLGHPSGWRVPAG